MSKTSENTEPTVDNKSPDILELKVVDMNGNSWGTLDLDKKEFSTGSKGFYATGKIKNPENPTCKYQVGCNVTLIGSKPKK